MHFSKNILFSILSFLSLYQVWAQNDTPLNIIFLIGDGTGLPQISAGNYVNNNQTALEGFSYIGLSKTHSNDNLVTDSAASATAMACGEKTNNKVIGKDAQNRPLKSVLELCQEKGYKTALLATSTIVHATPASFYAKVDSRYQYEAIANQLATSAVNYFIGGGQKFFVAREDNRNLIEEDSTREYVNNLSEFEASEAAKIGFLTAYEDPIKKKENRKPELPAMLAATLTKFEADQAPFFVMVEGSQIDWGGHDNDISVVLSEFKEFDQTVQTALNFAKKNKNTLVVVTGDHETGGLVITGGNVAKGRVKTSFSTPGHSGIMVPVFSYGPTAEQFNGIYENTEIFHKMSASLRLN